MINRTEIIILMYIKTLVYQNSEFDLLGYLHDLATSTGTNSFKVLITVLLYRLYKIKGLTQLIKLLLFWKIKLLQDHFSISNMQMHSDTSFFDTIFSTLLNYETLSFKESFHILPRCIQNCVWLNCYIYGK